MRSCLVILVLLAVFSASCRHQATAASYSARIGVAIKLPDRVCMAIHNSKLLPSATITLVAPADPARDIPVHTARALVALRDAAPCPGVQADPEISSYNLTITTGILDEHVPLVAMDARVPSVLSAHSFRACNSSDGVHLTAWDGAKPLEGHRLWHQYYALGQKLVENCTAVETVSY